MLWRQGIRRATRRSLRGDVELGIPFGRNSAQTVADGVLPEGRELQDKVTAMKALLWCVGLGPRVVGYLLRTAETCMETLKPCPAPRSTGGL